MPPHCDTRDGPIAKAALHALEEGNVNIVLPYVSKAGEAEVKNIFEKAMRVRSTSKGIEEVTSLADEWFLENVVRIHRAGEGAPYTGLKPAGLDVGPVIPVAEHAITKGSPEPLIALLTTIVQEETKRRFERMESLKKTVGHDVDHAREYVEAMLGLQVWAHTVYQAAVSDAHGEGHSHEHPRSEHSHK